MHQLDVNCLGADFFFFFGHMVTSWCDWNFTTSSKMTINETLQTHGYSCGISFTSFGITIYRCVLEANWQIARGLRIKMNIRDPRDAQAEDRSEGKRRWRLTCGQKCSTVMRRFKNIKTQSPALLQWSNLLVGMAITLWQSHGIR